SDGEGRRHEDRRGEPERRREEALYEPEDHREDEIERARDRDGAARIEAGRAGELLAAGDEGARGDVDERDDDVDERDPDEREHRGARGRAEVLSRDLGDRSAAVSHRSDQAREVVDGADQHDAEADPEEAGQPPEGLAGEDRSDDRSGRGDRREVLREEVERSRRYEIDAVGTRLGRGRARIVEEKMPRDEGAVELVARDEQDGERDRESGERHAE